MLKQRFLEIVGWLLYWIFICRCISKFFGDIKSLSLYKFEGTIYAISQVVVGGGIGSDFLSVASGGLETSWEAQSGPMPFFVQKDWTTNIDMTAHCPHGLLSVHPYFISSFLSD